MIKKILAGIIVVTVWSCTSQKPLTQTASNSADTIETKSLRIQSLYQKTPPRVWKLIHTNLKLDLRIPQQQVAGSAVLTLHPYFYKQSTLELDAKSFSIEKIMIHDRDTVLDADYEYDGRKVRLKLHREYLSSDTLELRMIYVANPTEVKSKSGKAIQAAQGIYFINPAGEQANKPTQVWTQGETEYSSCWFPTLDEPNQKTSQEIAVTVAEKYTTLSNGTLTFSTLNGDGTRTDFWEQTQPHSPYLAVLAVGEFSVVRDEWRDKEVSYFVEPAYEGDARAIFGNTPEMIDFYSRILGVDYPWDKYSQVVVRDFISGAMENTSATIHGEFVQQHKRELIDKPQDNIIAHELFHQWFGDLVSCESWANLPLNEAFATYGEYLWNEHKYGPDAADHHLYNNLRSYLAESNYKRVDWVRFNYLEKDQMFDSHTYSKGARILHMLRTWAGDEAFFEALNRYLNRYAHGSAEMHQLRLVFEEVTGEDYNWFFDQWAYQSGHPVLEIEMEYDSTNQNQNIVVRQKQDLKEHPLYQLPFSLEIHLGEEVRRYELWIRDEVNEYNIRVERRPDLVDFDSEKYLLAEKKEEKSEAEWTWQYQHCDRFVARLEAIRAIARLDSISYIGNDVLLDALDDPYYYIRLMAVNTSDNLERVSEEKAHERLLEMAFNDPHPKVRARALSQYILDFQPENQWELIAKTAADSSYHVLASALRLAAQLDTSAALMIAEKMEKEDNVDIWLAVAEVYSQMGGEDRAVWLEGLNDRLSDYNKYNYIELYKNYVRRFWKPEITRPFVGTLEEILDESNMMWVKRSAASGLRTVYESTEVSLQVMDDRIEDLEDNAAELNRLRSEREALQKEMDFITEVVRKVRSSQQEQQLLDLLPKVD